MKKNQLYPTDLTDHQWDCIKELIPAAKPGGHPRTLDMRAIVNAILYLTVTGCQWRLLPREYPAWQSVYTYFRTFRDDGTWQRIHDTLRSHLRERAGRHKHPTAGALVSQEAQMAGEIYFDMRNYKQAQEYFTYAIKAAQKAEDQTLVAVAIGRINVRPSHKEQLQKYLSLLQVAHRLAVPNATITTRAWLAAREAEAQANVGASNCIIP